MRKRHMAGLLCMALWIGIFAGCAEKGQPGETSIPKANSTAEQRTETTSTTPIESTPESTSETTTPTVTTARAPIVVTEPPNMPAEAYYANKIYVDGNQVMFIDPVTKFLSAGSMKTGKTEALTNIKAYDRFVVTPEYVFFGGLRGGTYRYRIGSGAKPETICEQAFYNGALLDGTLYFVEKPMRTDGTDLFAVKPDDPVKVEITRLEGNVYSYYHNTALVFAWRSVIYTARPGIVSLDLMTGKKTVLDAEYPYELLTKELVELSDDRLYPVNIYANMLPVTYEYYEFKEDGNSFRRHPIKDGYEFLSGENVVFTTQPLSKIYDILIGGKYVMVLYEGEDLYYLYDVGTLNVTELRGNKAVRQSVGLDEYLSGSENGVKLDPNFYSQLTMEEAAHVYYCAIRHQDKETMRDLYSGSTVEWYVYRPE